MTAAILAGGNRTLDALLTQVIQKQRKLFKLGAVENTTLLPKPIYFGHLKFNLSFANRLGKKTGRPVIRL